ARSALWILVPVAGIARPPDDDEVRPAVVIQVFGPAGEAAGIPFAARAGAVAVIFDLADLVQLPSRGLVPNITGQDVQLAVLVHVRDRHPFRTKHLVHHRLLPADEWRGGIGPLEESWDGQSRQEQKRK